jgi:hypothetical protein
VSQPASADGSEGEPEAEEAGEEEAEEQESSSAGPEALE